MCAHLDFDFGSSLIFGLSNVFFYVNRTIGDLSLIGGDPCDNTSIVMIDLKFRTGIGEIARSSEKSDGGALLLSPFPRALPAWVLS